MSWYRRWGKEWLDRIASGILLILLSPLMGILALLVRCRLGAPVFFRQSRPGKSGRPFELVKFRTMNVSWDVSGDEAPEGSRLGPFGDWMRSWSLDELPELWNVFRGEMSLVGPRPLLLEYLGYYTPRQMRRHEVKPGITGWAQVNGRNLVPWEERFEMDLWYIENLSFGLDLRIMGRTLWTSLLRHGVKEPGHTTPRKFRGSQ